MLFRALLVKCLALAATIGAEGRAESVGPDVGPPVGVGGFGISGVPAITDEAVPSHDDFFVPYNLRPPQVGRVSRVILAADALGCRGGCQQEMAAAMTETLFLGIRPADAADLVGAAMLEELSSPAPGLVEPGFGERVRRRVADRIEGVPSPARPFVRPGRRALRDAPTRPFPSRRADVLAEEARQEALMKDLDQRDLLEADDLLGVYREILLYTAVTDDNQPLEQVADAAASLGCTRGCLAEALSVMNRIISRGFSPDEAASLVADAISREALRLSGEARRVPLGERVRIRVETSPSVQPFGVQPR